MNETPSATAILAPIWRRKWLILIVGIVVAGGTYLYYKRKPLTFQSETQLYLSAGNEYVGEKGVAGKGASQTASAQPTIINSIVTEEARHQLKAQQNHTAKVAAKGKIKAKANEKSQFVNVTTTAHTPRAAGAAGEHDRGRLHPPSAQPVRARDPQPAEDRPPAARPDRNPGGRHQGLESERLGGLPGERDPRGPAAEPHQPARSPAADQRRRTAQAGQTAGRAAARAGAEKERRVRLRDRLAARLDRRLRAGTPGPPPADARRHRSRVPHADADRAADGPSAGRGPRRVSVPLAPAAGADASPAGDAAARRRSAENERILTPGRGGATGAAPGSSRSARSRARCCSSAPRPATGARP